MWRGWRRTEHVVGREHIKEFLRSSRTVAAASDCGLDSRGTAVSAALPMGSARESGRAGAPDSGRIQGTWGDLGQVNYLSYSSNVQLKAEQNLKAF